MATNTSTCCQPFSWIKWRSKAVRLFSSTAIARWVMSGWWPSKASTVIRTGSRNSLAASACTSGAKVAENSSVCRLAGSSASTRCNSSAKPKSSKRSASSSTKCCTSARRTAFWSIRSSKRPGVATTMSAPPRSAIICGLTDTPPNTVLTLSDCGSLYARWPSTSPTCTANSRVGTSTSTRTGRRKLVWRGEASKCCKSGSAKASVLPEPVGAVAHTSADFKTAGIASAWMGVGAYKPMSPTARKSAGVKPSGSKFKRVRSVAEINGGSGARR